MPSPFPGMDPFLQDHWGDVHTSLTTYARDQLRPQMPANLRVRVEEYVGLQIEGDLSRQKPDVLVTENWSSAGQTAVAVAEAVMADEPLVVTSPREPETLRRILIQDRRGARLVTAIEFLFPGSKYGEALVRFRKKQRELLSGGANLVEIDLIRGGEWTVFPPEAAIPGSHAAPYRVVVVRAARVERFECYPAGIRQCLPRIRVPLRPGDRDAVLDLQLLVDQAWEDGGYSDIDYARGPLPKFDSNDVEWIRERLGQQGIVRLI